MLMFRSRAALLDELAGLKLQHTAVLAELLAERRRADKALQWHNDWCKPDNARALAEAARADRAEHALAWLCRERRTATGKPCTCGTSQHITADERES